MSISALDLAAELGMEFRELRDRLADEGLGGIRPFSRIDDAAADAVRRRVAPADVIDLRAAAKPSSAHAGGPSDREIWRRVYVESKGYRLRILGLLATEFLATPLFLLTPIPLAIVVDSVIGGEELPGWIDALLPASIGTSEILAFAAVLQVLVVLLTDVQVLGTTVLRTHTTEHLTLRLRSRLFSHLQRLSFSFHDRRGAADSLYRIQYDSTSLGAILVENVVPLVASIVTLASVFFVVLRLDPTLAFLALAIMPFLAVLANVSKSRLRRHYKESKRLESDAMGVVHEVLGSFRVVKAFGREDAEQERFEGKSAASVRKKVDIAAREGALDLLINLTTAVGTGLVLYVGAHRVQAGAVTVGQLLVVINYLARLYTPLKTITRRVTGLQRSYESLQRSFDVLDEEPDVQERPNAIGLKRARGAVELRDVSFGYDDEHKVLEHVSFVAPAGARVGIAGPTGAGKTTLVSLLLRFYDVSDGQVLLDGVDIRDYKLADLRSQFAMVLQEPVLFATSIGENIAYGRPGASSTDIRDAARLAGADRFISRLADGYDTRVGERGQRLSGGERQRISLARAFLKDAPILLLDEPTSSVDVVTEAAIMEAMGRLMEGRTTFMVAHRLSTLDVCDQRIELELSSTAAKIRPVAT